MSKPTRHAGRAGRRDHLDLFFANNVNRSLEFVRSYVRYVPMIPSSLAFDMEAGQAGRDENACPTLKSKVGQIQIVPPTWNFISKPSRPFNAILSST